MKKLLAAAVIAGFALLAASVSHAQVVFERPTSPVAAVKPPPPYPRAVWIEPEWRWDAPSHAYVYVPGIWVKARRGFVWVPGHWISIPGGFTWVTGHWRRIR